MIRVLTFRWGFLFIFFMSSSFNIYLSQTPQNTSNKNTLYQRKQTRNLLLLGYCLSAFEQPSLEISVGLMNYIIHVSGLGRENVFHFAADQNMTLSLTVCSWCLYQFLRLCWQDWHCFWGSHNIHWIWSIPGTGKNLILHQRVAKQNLLLSHKITDMAGHYICFFLSGKLLNTVSSVYAPFCTKWTQNWEMSVVICIMTRWCDVMSNQIFVLSDQNGVVVTQFSFQEEKNYLQYCDVSPNLKDFVVWHLPVRIFWRAWCASRCVYSVHCSLKMKKASFSLHIAQLSQSNLQ